MSTALHERGVHILARSLFRDLIDHGYEPVHVVALSTELLELIASALRDRAAAAGTPEIQDQRSAS